MTQNFNVQVKNNSNSEIEYSDNIDCVNVKSGIKSILSQNKHLKTGDYTIYLTNDNQKYRYYTSNHNNSQMTEDHSGKQLYNINVMTGGSNVVDVSYPKLIRARNSDNAVKQLVKIIPKFQNDNYKIDVKQIGGLFDNSFIHGQPIAHDLQIRSSKSNSQSYNSNINYYPHAMYEGNPIQQIQSLNTLTKGSSGKNNKKQTIPHGVMPGSVMPYGSMPYMSMPFNMVAPLHFDVKKTDDLVFITGQFAKDIIDEISIIINTFLALPTISVNSSTIERIIKLWLIGKYLQQIPDEITLFKVFLNMPDSEKFMEKLELYIVSPDFSKMVEISKKQFDKWEKDSSSNNLNDKDVFLNFMKSEIQYLEHQTGGSSDINSRLNKGDFILLFRFENFISDENQKVLKNSTITDPVLNNEKNKTVAPKYVKAIADEITANRVVSMMIKTNLTSNIRDIIQHAKAQKLFEDHKYNSNNGKGDIYSQQVGGMRRTPQNRTQQNRALQKRDPKKVSTWPKTLTISINEERKEEQMAMHAEQQHTDIIGEYHFEKTNEGIYQWRKGGDKKTSTYIRYDENDHLWLLSEAFTHLRSLKPISDPTDFTDDNIWISGGWDDEAIPKENYTSYQVISKKDEKKDSGKHLEKSLSVPSIITIKNNKSKHTSKPASDAFSDWEHYNYLEGDYEILKNANGKHKLINDNPVWKKLSGNVSIQWENDTWVVKKDNIDEGIGVFAVEPQLAPSLESKPRRRIKSFQEGIHLQEQEQQPAHERVVSHTRKEIMQQQQLQQQLQQQQPKNKPENPILSIKGDAKLLFNDKDVQWTLNISGKTIDGLYFSISKNFTELVTESNLDFEPTALFKKINTEVNKAKVKPLSSEKIKKLHTDIFEKLKISELKTIEEMGNVIHLLVRLFKSRNENEVKIIKKYLPSRFSEINLDSSESEQIEDDLPKNIKITLTNASDQNAIPFNDEMLKKNREVNGYMMWSNKEYMLFSNSESWELRKVNDLVNPTDVSTENVVDIDNDSFKKETTPIFVMSGGNDTDPTVEIGQIKYYIYSAAAGQLIEKPVNITINIKAPPEGEGEASSEGEEEEDFGEEY